MPYLKLATNQSIQMRSASFTIGSDPTCDLSLSGRTILPRHLILQSREDGWQVATLSLSATLAINGRPVTSLALLKDGDYIQVGDVTLVWRELDVHRVQTSAWKGLLTIFLLVMMLLSAVFAWFGFSQIHDQKTMPSVPIITPAADSPSGAQDNADGAGVPLFRLVVPTLPTDE